MSTSKTRKTVLVIDDDVEVAETVGDLLRDRFEIQLAHTAGDGLDAVNNHKPDIIILDRKLRGEDGLILCENLRNSSATQHIPIIIYSACDDVDDLAEAFSKGADDFISKASRPKEFLARVLAKVRRLEEVEDGLPILKCGNLVMDIAALEVKIEGKLIQLSVLEFNLLKFFLQNTQRVIDRDEIMQGVWKDQTVSVRTVDTHMVYLRKKLIHFDHQLVTVYGAGYALKAIPASERIAQKPNADVVAEFNDEIRDLKGSAKRD